MKNEENQQLKHKPLLLVFACLGLLAVLVLPSWGEHFDEEKVVSAKQRAEVLGYQVFELYREAANAQMGGGAQQMVNSRSPASVRTAGEEMSSFREAGSIGNDPWGQPFKYTILNSDPQLLRVQIWSAGPNMIFESKDDLGKGVGRYEGDDVGVVLSMSQNKTQ